MFATAKSNTKVIFAFLTGVLFANLLLFHWRGNTTTACKNELRIKSTSESDSFTILGKTELPTQPALTKNNETAVNNFNCTPELMKRMFEFYDALPKNHQNPLRNQGWTDVCRSKPRKIILGFPWSGEWDHLEIQVETHFYSAEKIIIGEGDKTFAGHNKPIFYNKAPQLLRAELREKIEHVQMRISDEDLRKNQVDEFYLEEKARRTLAGYAQKFTSNPSEDLYYQGDIDQLIRFEVLWLLKWCQDIPPLAYKMGMQNLVQNFHWRYPNDWMGSPNHNSMFQMNAIEEYPKSTLYNSGWHLQWFFHPIEWVQKMKTYSHAEWFKPELATLEWIIHCKMTGADPYKRVFGNGPEPNPTPDDLPKFIKDNPLRFAFMIWPPVLPEIDMGH